MDESRHKGLSGFLVIRAPAPSWPNHLSKAPPPNTITVRVSISTYESGPGLVEGREWGPEGGATNIQSMASSFVSDFFTQICFLRSIHVAKCTSNPLLLAATEWFPVCICHILPPAHYLKRCYTKLPPTCPLWTSASSSEGRVTGSLGVHPLNSTN